MSMTTDKAPYIIFVSLLILTSCSQGPGGLPTEGEPVSVTLPPGIAGLAIKDGTLLWSEPQSIDCPQSRCDHDIVSFDLRTEKREKFIDTKQTDMILTISDDLLLWSSLESCEQCERELRVMMRNLSGEEAAELLILKNITTDLQGISVNWPRVAVAVYRPDTLNNIWVYDHTTGEAQLLNIQEPKPADRVSLPYDLSLHKSMLFYQHWRVRGGEFVPETRVIDLDTNQSRPIDVPNGTGSAGFTRTMSSSKQGVVFVVDRVDTYEIWKFDHSTYSLLHESQTMLRHPQIQGDLLAFVTRGDKDDRIKVIDMSKEHEILNIRIAGRAQTLLWDGDLLAVPQFVSAQHVVTIVSLTADPSGRNT